VRIVTLASRPDLVDSLYDFPGAWPTFMVQDPTADLYYGDAHEAYPEFIMLALDDEAGDEVVARSFSVPLAWDGEVTGELPAGGWDWVIQQSCRTRFAGETPNLVSAIEITIQVDRRSTGLAPMMLEAMRANVTRLGFSDLVAPVRPNGKPDSPDQPIGEYATRVRDDGLPHDPWLRVHVRAGGRIVNPAPNSMAIPGTVDQWRTWTGLPFDESGPVHVPGALVPVLCDLEHGYAVYVEPNVWVHHRLTS
jgi:hypothetical protein